MGRQEGGHQFRCLGLMGQLSGNCTLSVMELWGTWDPSRIQPHS